jgi:hypothetical protein
MWYVKGKLEKAMNIELTKWGLGKRPERPKGLPGQDRPEELPQVGGKTCLTVTSSGLFRSLTGRTSGPNNLPARVFSVA